MSFLLPINPDTEEFPIIRTLTGSDHSPTIAALDNHAAVVSSSRKVASPELHRSFAEFVRLFEDSGYKEGYLEGTATDVTKAYYEFLQCMSTEVQDVPQGN